MYFLVDVRKRINFEHENLARPSKPSRLEHQMCDATGVDFVETLR